jgi:hypothetical protein
MLHIAELLGDSTVCPRGNMVFHGRALNLLTAPEIRLAGWRHPSLIASRVSVFRNSYG